MKNIKCTINVVAHEKNPNVFIAIDLFNLTRNSQRCDICMLKRLSIFPPSYFISNHLQSVVSLYRDP